ncbi:hypothetical protein O6H91_01G048500 [Diphasiastrum complanatum]|uniref:Uncharacterized protein n=1 Tax=Diphasiastrum complanatum TaxID=34168 RepID=A0ACC2EQZ6_DIPCM|nr:hypothetical protein O6H91_01G048500 [Diphasiastrum complanatum]
MPLVRYELHNEYKLANRELFSAAPKHDSEAMLEGVAMVGLVGVVRQLGNLAEFAADMFHDLHEQVTATTARGHELQVRVRQLERVLPLAEKFALSETNQLRFAYSTVFEWHASIPNYQNHCSEGDLPKFIQNYYQECRGPPRLLLLDRFDNGGTGACLKRYSDPSYFKMNWASVQLAKMKKVREDRKAQRGKKSREHLGTPRRVRYSSLSSGILESLKTKSNYWSNIEDQSEKSVASALIHESGLPSGKYLSGLNNLPVWPPENFHKLKESLAQRNCETLKLSARDVEIEALSDRFQNVYLTSELKSDLGDSFARINDFTVEGDQFVDAMTTMESETESELGARQESDTDSMKYAKQREDISLLRHSSENGSLDIQKEDASIHELDDMSEHTLDSVDLVVGSTEGSRSMSPSHSSLHSLNDQPKHLAEDTVQVNDPFWQASQASAKKRTPGNANDTFFSQGFVQTRAQTSNFLPSKCGHKFTSGNNANGYNSTGPYLGRSQRRQFSESKGRKAYEQNKAKEAELNHMMEPGPTQSFPTVHPRESKANINQPIDTLGISDNNGISKMAPAQSISCHTSSLTPGSSGPCAEAELISPDSSCISIELSPKSPIFSALDSPMSPIRGSHLTASMSGRFVQMEKIRPSSPTGSSDLPSSPSSETVLPSLSPQANWNSTQTLQTPLVETSRPLPAPPIPPPLPPPPIHFPPSPLFLDQRSDHLIESISMYDRNKLRKVHTETPSRLMDERDILLEQIRTRSFSLRRTKVDKFGTLPRSKEEINVVAILEKANAIRQAFMGSDEEDEDENWNESSIG